MTNKATIPLAMAQAPGERDVIAEATDSEGDNLTERDRKVIAYWRSLGWTIPRRELTGEAAQ